jgi:hypothetical protein
MPDHTNNYPKLHNATWPGVVGKGAPDSEPIIPLDTLLTLTANAEYEGQKFDGVDLWLADPHISIDSSKDDIKRVSDHIASFGLKVGSFVAPIWGGAGGGSAMGDADEVKRFLTQVEKACQIGQWMREIGIRPTGGVRVDSSTGVEAWDQDPEGNTKKIADTFREAGRIAQSYGEYIVAEGEICWGGMHSWRENVKLLELVNMPGVVGYQADMAHSMPPTTRWPTHSAPGRSISTSPRTTAPPSARVTTKRPAATARSTTPTGGSMWSSTLATGCATKPATSPSACATSAGTAACSPTRSWSSRRPGTRSSPPW